MEQITRRDGKIFYGEKPCCSGDEAYRLFRNEYTKIIGKDANRRLNREGRRTDILHWKGFSLTVSYMEALESRFGSSIDKINSSILGIICTSYCRIIDSQAIKIDDDDIDRYIDWMLSTENNVLKLVHRKNGLGRTNKRNNNF